MAVDVDGVVMNENHEQLPRDCSSISREYAFTIHAGRSYAQDIPGMVFGMSEHEIRVLPCSRVEVTFVNEDEVRHQWMVHGLPNYLYPAGMFHIEVSGGYSKTGTFIVPGDDRTYLHQGIAARPFQRSFVLAEHVDIESASLERGLLHVDLIRHKPETVVRTIKIEAVE